MPSSSETRCRRFHVGTGAALGVVACLTFASIAVAATSTQAKDGHTAASAPLAAKSGSHPAAAIAPFDQSTYADALSFRLIGPFRGGRSTAVAGVPGQPRTFYMGSTGGGVWK